MAEYAVPQLTTGRCPRPSEPVGFETPPPCLCRYGLRKVDGAPGMFPLDPFGHYTRDWGVYAFRIHPKCPHHGDAAYTETARITKVINDLAAHQPDRERAKAWRQMEADEAAYWVSLDEQERSGH